MQDANRERIFVRLATIHLTTRHRHARAFAVPWHTDEWVLCPPCGDDFIQEQVFLGLRHERRVLLREIYPQSIGGIGRIV